MVVGGPCSVEGCKRTHMYNSPVCYTHKDKAEEIWWAETDERFGDGDSVELDTPTILGLLLLDNLIGDLIWKITIMGIGFALFAIYNAN